MLPVKQDVISMIEQLPEQQLQKIVNYIPLLKNEKKHKERGKVLIARRHNAASLKNRNGKVMRSPNKEGSGMNGKSLSA